MIRPITTARDQPSTPLLAFDNISEFATALAMIGLATLLPVLCRSNVCSRLRGKDDGNKSVNSYYNLSKFVKLLMDKSD
ncbi:hypothetical protein [Methylobacterium gregans]|uniref:hypothetical protein n=1 Tax=Methylobacterium gregans TaxID=374424 RepID=UPI001EE35560|nr:hypothetical protein [Methylobacterium gregans]MDQ0521924.1 hypothetical protein [Methylobacterium gregans]